MPILDISSEIINRWFQPHLIGTNELCFMNLSSARKQCIMLWPGDYWVSTVSQLYISQTTHAYTRYNIETGLVIAHTTMMIARLLHMLSIYWWNHAMETFPALLALCQGIHRWKWIPLTKASEAELWYFLSSAPQQTFRDTGDLTRHRTHYDITVMYLWIHSTFI